MKQLIVFIVIAGILVSANTPKPDCTVSMAKAKQISDSVLFSRLGKDAAERFYVFNSKESLFPCREYKEYKNKYPRDFSLVYNLKGFPVECQTSIILDANFKVEAVGLIADTACLKKFISKSELRTILKGLNGSKRPMIGVRYDSSIYHKLTYKPFIEVRHYVRTVEDEDGQCLSNIDSCLAIDPHNGTVLRWYYSERMSCF